MKSKTENAPAVTQGANQKILQGHFAPVTQTNQKTIKPLSIIRKSYLPQGIHTLECIGWQVNPPSQGLREKLVYWFKANGTPFDELTTGRYYNVYRDDNNIQYFPPRSDYTREIGRLWPRNDDIRPDDLVGETVRCEVAEQTKDRRRKEIKTGVRPTLISEIIGWPE